MCVVHVCICVHACACGGQGLIPLLLSTFVLETEPLTGTSSHIGWLASEFQGLATSSTTGMSDGGRHTCFVGGC